MHPILIRIPLPPWVLPLFPSLIALAGVGVLLALLGWSNVTRLFEIG